MKIELGEMLHLDKDDSDANQGYYVDLHLPNMFSEGIYLLFGLNHMEFWIEVFGFMIQYSDGRFLLASPNFYWYLKEVKEATK